LTKLLFDFVRNLFEFGVPNEAAALGASKQWFRDKPIALRNEKRADQDSFLHGGKILLLRE
jgi:hypothetical protein